jgi:hypothetical protein
LEERALDRVHWSKIIEEAEVVTGPLYYRTRRRTKMSSRGTGRKRTKKIIKLKTVATKNKEHE